MKRAPAVQGNEGTVARLYFVPTRTFLANGPGGRRSEYIEGMYYNARTPEIEAFAREWERQGKVKFMSAPRATTQGKLETA